MINSIRVTKSPPTCLVPIGPLRQPAPLAGLKSPLSTFSAVCRYSLPSPRLSQLIQLHPTAKAFYAKVWGWTFKPNPPDSTHYTDDGLAMFSCPDGKLMGGIKKVEDEVDIKKTKGGTMVYLWADSIEDQGEVCPPPRPHLPS